MISPNCPVTFSLRTSEPVGGLSTSVVPVPANPWYDSFNKAKDPMTHPTPDANGTIYWSEAVQFVFSPDPDLNFLVQFARDYGHLFGERVDLGELEVWYSELAVAAIADCVFG